MELTYLIRFSNGEESFLTGYYHLYLTTDSEDDSIDYELDVADSEEELNIEKAKQIASKHIGIGNWIDCLPNTVDKDPWGGYTVAYRQV